MKFDQIIKHLSGRGFVTRKMWSGWSVLLFGMDNCPWIANRSRPKLKARLDSWAPCLAEIKADDWIVLPYVWNGSKDDYLPFKKKDPLLTSLRQERRLWLRQREREIRSLKNSSIIHNLKVSYPKYRKGGIDV